MSDLLGDTIAAIETTMRFRAQRQGALASNVANADTPGYRPIDLKFEAALDEAHANVWRTHARHMPVEPAQGGGYRVEEGPEGLGPDGNGVDLDRAVVDLSRNAGAYKTQAQVMTRLLSMKRQAISGEGSGR